METIPQKDRESCLLLLKMFKLEGQTMDKVITEGQLEIFYNLVARKNNRVHIETATQYGKSLIVALAGLVITCIQGEVASVVAPTDDKAKIIMRYYIEHLGDHPMFYSQLDKETKLERLRQELSKDRIILRNGGGIFVVSAQATNTRRTIESAMGLGSRIVLQDESCLIPDNTEATIFRMIAGKGADAFYCKIGNPFYRNPPYTHFYKSYRDPNYHVVKIDYLQGLREGRFQPEFIEEAKKKPHFDILFECNFPARDAIDARGYSPLLTEEDLDGAYKDKLQFFGDNRLGVDVAGGGTNYSVIVLRSDNGAKVLYRNKLSDTMTLVGIVLRLAEEHDVSNGNISVDTVGVGKGVYDRLCEQLEGLGATRINSVNVGEKAQNSEDFINLRAQGFWRLSRWIKEGGKLDRDVNFEELLNIKYKVQSDKRVKIIGKDELLKDGIQSPDVADALMLTFINIGRLKGAAPQYKMDWTND